MKRPLQLLALLAFLLPLHANAFRYAQPVNDRLVFSEILNATQAAPYVFYLPKRGRYYVEVMREGHAGPSPAQQVDLTFTVNRGQKVLYEKHAAHALAPDDQGATLFWFDCRDDVPERQELLLSIAVNAPMAVPLRVQVSRKFEQLPVPILR